MGTVIEIVCEMFRLFFGGFDIYYIHLLVHICMARYAMPGIRHSVYICISDTRVVVALIL